VREGGTEGVLGEPVQVLGITNLSLGGVYAGEGSTLGYRGD